MSIKCDYCTVGQHDSAIGVRDCAREYYRNAPPAEIGTAAHEHLERHLPRQSPSRVAHEEERNELFEDLREVRDAVAAGDYIVVGDDGEWESYRVEKPIGGKWHGYTFLKKFGRDKVPRRCKGMKIELAVLTKIAADMDGAAQRFADLGVTPCR